MIEQQEDLDDLIELIDEQLADDSEYDPESHQLIEKNLEENSIQI